MWIGNGFTGTLSRILTAYDQLSAPFYPDKTVAGLIATAVGDGDLWVGLSDRTLLRMNSSSLARPARRAGSGSRPGDRHQR